jgi:3'-phosphoadenosine 5'-phosphosulfate sulfotransferase (PAPS reductase)/FAD synthetase
MDNNTITHLKELEAESIYVLREVAAQFERPVILFSGGKDSIVVTHLAYKAFYPAKLPFPLLHIDTGHNFKETIDYRDQLVGTTGCRAHRGLGAREHRPGPCEGGDGLLCLAQQATDGDAARHAGEV